MAAAISVLPSSAPLPQAKHTPLGEQPSTADGPSAAPLSTGQPMLPRVAAARLWNSGAYCMLVAALKYSVVNAVVKQVRVPLTELLLARGLLALLGSATVAAGDDLWGPRRLWPHLALRGVCNAVSVLAQYESFRRLPLGDALAIYYTSRPLTALLARIALHEPLGWRSGLGCLVAMAGALVVAQPGGGLLQGGQGQAMDAAHLSGTLLAALSALLAAGAFTGTRALGRRVSAVSLAVWFHAMSMLLSGALLLLSGAGAPVAPSRQDAARMLFIGLASFGAQLLFIRGYSITPASQAATLDFSQVIWAQLIGAVALGEPITAASAAGILLVACGMALVARERASK